MSYGLVFYIVALLIIVVRQTYEFRLRLRNGKIVRKGQFLLETLGKLILAVSFPWFVAAFHETAHGIGAIIDGIRISEITWWPFTGFMGTLVSGESPEFFFFFGPYLFESCLFVASFIAFCFFRPLQKFPRLLVLFGMGIPFFDTLVSTLLFFRRKTDFGIIAALFPGVPYLPLYLFLIGFYFLGLCIFLFGEKTHAEERK